MYHEVLSDFHPVPLCNIQVYKKKQSHSPSIYDLSIIYLLCLHCQNSRATAVLIVDPIETSQIQYTAYLEFILKYTQGISIAMCCL